MTSPSLGAPPTGVGFYGGPFSNFVGGPFQINVRNHWPESAVFDPIVLVRTVEHYFQAAKARTALAAGLVLGAVTPGAAKRLGRQLDLRPDWDEIKYEVMLHGLYSKFFDPYFRDQLLATGDQLLFEASPTDAVWGLWDPVAESWTGQNLLGKALMQIRDEVR